VRARELCEVAGASILHIVPRALMPRGCNRRRAES
jgi:hypothetical protein